MNRIAGLLLALFLPIAILHAQPPGKVVIVSSYYSSALDTIVKAECAEPVESDSILPANLDEYDALFLQVPYLDSATQSRLVQFIDRGGKLYVETSEHIVDSTDISNPLWLRFGIKGNLLTAFEFFVNSVHGVGNEFARNIFDSLSPDGYQSGYGGPFGSIAPVLVADGGAYIQPMAYISEDSSIRMILSETNGNDYPGYYSQFIGDVICNYFNLCAERVRPASSFAAPVNFSIAHDPRVNSLSVYGDFSMGAQVSVLNLLGVTVWYTSARPGVDLVELPSTLPNGVYFVSVQCNGKTSTRLFAIAN